MKRHPLCFALLAALLAPSGIRAAQGSHDAGLQKKPLFAPGTVKAWSASESGIQESNARSRAGAPSWHWHVSVDHHAGEPKYPIGWPRISRVIPPGPDRDWAGWDFLRMWVFTTTSRDRLPGVPAGLTLHTPDRAGAYNRTLTELRKGQWTEIRIPLSQVPRHHDVRQLQFHLAESNYQHGDKLDLYIADLALLRYATPTLLHLTAGQAAVFDDARRIPVNVTVAGVRPGSSASVVCELWRQGRVVARTTAALTHGPQRLVLEPAAGSLVPGTYELQAGFAGQGQAAAAVLRVVESPWR